MLWSITGDLLVSFLLKWYTFFMTILTYYIKDICKILLEIGIRIGVDYHQKGERGK